VHQARQEGGLLFLFGVGAPLRRRRVPAFHVRSLMDQLATPNGLKSSNGATLVAACGCVLYASMSAGRSWSHVVGCSAM